MAKQDVIAGLDMGSGRVTCLIGSPGAGSEPIKVLGGASVICRGIKGGVRESTIAADVATVKCARGGSGTDQGRCDAYQDLPDRGLFLHACG